MATEKHTRPNASNATPGLIGVVLLLAIAFSTYCIRMVTRIRPVFKLTASDYIVTAALVSQHPHSFLCNCSNPRCIGVRTDYAISSAGHD